jgi:hypothetical protein
MNTPPEEILLQLARSKPAPLRAAWLDRECAGDPALRARVEALLAAEQKSETALGARIAKTLAQEPGFPETPDETVGQRLGPYKLLEKIGEGGCGVVYVAEQTEPVRRRVALKVIKVGMDTKAVVARFEDYAEAEPFLIESCQGLQQRRASLSPHLNAPRRITESLERLVQLYDAWGKPTQAAEWIQKLAAFQQANKATEQKGAKP